MKKSHLGAEAEQVLFTRNSLGEMYFRQGRTSEAQAIFEEVLAARRRVLGQDHPELATSINNLAVAAQTVGRPGQSQGPAARGARHPPEGIRRGTITKLALTLNNLAAVEGEINQLPEAIAHMQEAMAINTAPARRKPPDPRRSSTQPGFFLPEARSSSTAPARFTARRSPAVVRLMAKNTRWWRRPLRNLGGPRRRDRTGDGPKMRFREALLIDRQVLPANDPRIANSLSGLGRLAVQTWRSLVEAETWFREELCHPRRSTAAELAPLLCRGLAWAGSFF